MRGDGGGVCRMEDDAGAGGAAGHPCVRVVVVEVRLDQKRLMRLEQDRDPRRQPPVERRVLRCRHERALGEIDGEGTPVGRVLRLAHSPVEVDVMALAVDAHLDAVDLQRPAARKPEGVAELLLVATLHVADVRGEHDGPRRSAGADRRNPGPEDHRGDDHRNRAMGGHGQHSSSHCALRAWAGGGVDPSSGATGSAAAIQRRTRSIFFGDRAGPPQGMRRPSSGPR